MNSGSVAISKRRRVTNYWWKRDSAVIWIAHTCRRPIDFRFTEIGADSRSRAAQQRESESRYICRDNDCDCARFSRSKNGKKFGKFRRKRERHDAVRASSRGSCSIEVGIHNLFVYNAPLNDDTSRRTKKRAKQRR